MEKNKIKKKYIKNDIIEIYNIFKEIKQKINGNIIDNIKNIGTK